MSVSRVGAAGDLGEIYELGTASMQARILTRGGSVLSLLVPDRDGQLDDVTLGLGEIADYRENHVFFGALIGRYGNRIARGELPLGGRVHGLTVNDGPNHLHGGPGGFHTALWDVREVRHGEEPALVLAHESPDGDQGYPGTLKVEVTYTLTREPALRIEYRARTDRHTVVSLTQHSYFNLAGQGSIDGHVLRLAAARFLPVDTGMIPTGELRPVAGTPFDFRSPTALGARVAADDQQLRLGSGYDHCFVVDGWDSSLRTVGELRDPISGRRMILRSTQPGVQLYSGNHLGGVPGKAGVVYQPRAGLCLEAQHFPDSPHHPDFPSTELQPGDEYRQVTEYAFSTGSG